MTEPHLCNTCLIVKLLMALHPQLSYTSLDGIISPVLDVVLCGFIHGCRWDRLNQSSFCMLSSLVGHTI